ncbi:VOC family protein [Marinilactibacillus kalidii]|uniref:VOC family protein n=1 Tax=Marinilactibacillus kalidii TaxID=2820274 RepID=UPI001ABE5E89|nr:VOC family protein [Marinilactibacillus kalidii]
MNRINLITLGVTDIVKSRAFYKGLGFKCYDDTANPPIIFFDNEGTKLELFPLDELVKDIDKNESLKTDRSVFNGITFAMNTKEKHEVDELMLLAESLGGEIVKKPETVFWGGYSGYFKDLDGYYWEVAYADSWEFDDQDMLMIQS